MDEKNTLDECWRKGFSLSPHPEQPCLSILGFANPQMQVLLLTGGLPVTAFEAEEYAEGEIHPGTVLVCSTEAQGDLADNQPPDELTDFLNGMYLGRYDEQAGHSLLFKVNLPTLLLRHRDSIFARQNNDTEFGGHFVTIHRCEVRKLEGKENYSGRCDVCSCGEPLCLSGYCWKAAGQVLMYFTMTGGMVSRAHLFPRFRVIDS